MTNTTTKKRITKVMRFEDIKAMLNGNEPVNGSTVAELMEFCDLQIKQLSKERKQTATQKENEGYKTLILNYLATLTEGVTCTTIKENVPELSGFEVNKTTSLVKQLADSNQIKRETIKGRSYFSIV